MVEQLRGHWPHIVPLVLVLGGLASRLRNRLRRRPLRLPGGRVR